MRRLTVAFFVLSSGFAATGRANNLDSLTARVVSPSRLADDSLIIGRTVCGEETWLFTESPALIGVRIGRRTASVTPVRGFRPEDRPWGLACLTNNELWTLAAARTLARLSPEGQVVERLSLGQPYLGVYGVGDRLLLLQPPLRVGTPLLASGLPREPSDRRLWPGVVARRPITRDADVTTNLLNCGVGAGGYVPCWFVKERRVTVSDGSAQHTSSPELRFIAASPVDESAPIWDVALAGTSRMWVLTTSRTGVKGRPIGGRLTKSNRRGDDEGHLDLLPQARIILSATDKTCVLLSSNGELVEVMAR